MIRVLKVITTVLIAFMMLIISWFCKGFTWKRDKANVVGFGFMEIIYLLSVVCMWL